MGDIVIFHPREGAVAKPEWYEDDVFIKRIVATAGDTVEARRPSAYTAPCTCFELFIFCWLCQSEIALRAGARRP